MTGDIPGGVANGSHGAAPAKGKRSSQTADAAPFRLLVVSESPDRAGKLAGHIERVAPLEVTIASTAQRAAAAQSVLFDIAIVHLGLSLASLSWSLRMRAALGHPELIFVTDDAADSGAAGLRELGIGPILTSRSAPAWLAKATLGLVRMARARRALQQASAGLPRLPTDPESSRFPGLFQAEQRFRESYVRALIGRTKSRGDAAAEARVSYRTLCHILKKLGVSSRPLT